jgi:two-component system cell cycle response regulator
LRILIADDELVSRRLLEAALVRLGHTFVAVKDGPEALNALLDPDGPRLAILDWMMPGADGLAVCRAIRKRPTPAPYVYVILLTARDRREDMVAALDAEADDFLTKPFDAVELRVRLRSGERVLALQERLLEVQEELRIEATHDALTGLWNRGMVLDQLRRELRRAHRERGPLAVIMADIDHFKCINDAHGHEAGDEVLRQTAKSMRSALRDYDGVGRYGGEEFLFLLPRCDATVAGQVAERVRAAVAAAPVCVGDVPLTVTASLGVACTRSSGDEPNALIRAADEALYRAKGHGRNRVEK